MNWSKWKSHEYDSVKTVGIILIIVLCISFIASRPFFRNNFLLGLINPGDTTGIDITLTSIAGAESVEKGIYGIGIAKMYEEFSTEAGWLDTAEDLIGDLDVDNIRYPVGGEVKWHHVWTDHLEQDLTDAEQANLRMGPTGTLNEIPGLGELYADRAYEELELANDGEINELMGQKGKYNSYADLNGDGAHGFFDFQWAQPRNFVHDMIDLNEATDTSMLYVINDRYATPAAVAQEVEYLLDQGVTIDGYECGNEVYANYRTLFPGNPNTAAPAAVNAYLAKCDTYKTAILAVDPGARIAVAASPKRGFEEGGGLGDNDSDFNGQWNEALAANMSAHGYNDYVMHFYHGFFSCIDEVQTNNKDSVFECGREELRTFNNAQPGAADSMVTSMPPIFDYFYAAFPGKKMWLTEWNINQDPTRTNSLYANSVLHAIFTQQFLTQMNEANARHGNFIDFASYHTFGTDGGNAMVNKRGTGAGSEPVDIGSFVRRTPYYAFMSMKDIYNDGYTPLASSFTLDSADVNEEDITVSAYKGTDGKIAIAFTNTSNKTVVVNSITLDGQAVDISESSADGYFMDGADNGASRGKTEFSKNPGDEVVIRDESYTSVDSAFLPGFGMGTFIVDPEFEVSALTGPSPDNNEEFTSETINYKTLGAGQGGTLRIQLMKPEDALHPLPLVLFIGGGSFNGGGLGSVTGYETDFTGAGYAVGSVEYRPDEVALFPAQLDDLEAAVAFMRANAETYNIDPNKIAIGGFSSGAMLASIVGTRADTPETRPNAVIDLSGSLDPNNPYNVSDAVETAFKSVFGCTFEEACPGTQDGIAANFADANDPAFLIIHGTSDTQVSPENSSVVDDIFDQAGIQSTFIAAEGLGHDKEAVLSDYAPDIINYLDATLYDADTFANQDECGLFASLFGTCGNEEEPYEPTEGASCDGDEVQHGDDDWELYLNNKTKHNKYNSLYEGAPTPVTMKFFDTIDGSLAYTIEDMTNTTTNLNDVLIGGHVYTTEVVDCNGQVRQTAWEVDTTLTVQGGGNGGGGPTDPVPDTTAPSAPTGLVATDIGEENVSLAWGASTDNIGVVSYEIYESGDLVGETENISSLINDLEEGTAYSFTVRALDAAGNSSSDSAALNVSTLVPPVPPKACEDGEDNDNDDLVDMADNNCSSPIDDDESGPAPIVPKQCNDGIDNDGDDDIDGNDPGCSSDNDNSENSDGPEKQCEDETDNDGDSTVDMADGGCSSASDNTENSNNNNNGNGGNNGGNNGGGNGGNNGGGGNGCNFLQQLFGQCGGNNGGNNGGGGGNNNADNVNPTVTITSPSQGSTLAPATTISASATDNHSVAKVEFYVAGIGLLGTDSSAPYKYNWNTVGLTPGTYNIKAKAFDAAGNTNESANVTVIK